MSRYGMGLIVVTVVVVAAAAAHSGLSSKMTVDSAKSAIPEFSDEAAPEVAGSLPEDVPMQDLPSGITRDIPAVRGHKFVKFDDRILVVSSEGRLVVAMIPRYKLLP